MQRGKTKRIITMEGVMNNPRYRGYHVVVVAGKVFKAKTGERASEILNVASHPGFTPLGCNSFTPPVFAHSFARSGVSWLDTSLFVL